MENPKPIFLEVFGECPMNKVLNFLVTSEEFDYSMTEIAEYSEVGYSTLKLFWNNLVSNQIVKFTRQVGNAKMYQLNKDNDVVKKFRKFYWAIVDQVTNETLEKRKVKVQVKA